MNILSRKTQKDEKFDILAISSKKHLLSSHSNKINTYLDFKKNLNNLFLKSKIFFKTNIYNSGEQIFYENKKKIILNKKRKYWRRLYKKNSEWFYSYRQKVRQTKLKFFYLHSKSKTLNKIPFYKNFCLLKSNSLTRFYLKNTFLPTHSPFSYLLTKRFYSFTRSTSSQFKRKKMIKRLKHITHRRLKLRKLLNKKLNYEHLQIFISPKSIYHKKLFRRLQVQHLVLKRKKYKIRKFLKFSLPNRFKNKKKYLLSCQVKLARQLLTLNKRALIFNKKNDFFKIKNLKKTKKLFKNVNIKLKVNAGARKSIKKNTKLAFLIRLQKLNKKFVFNKKIWWKKEPFFHFKNGEKFAKRYSNVLPLFIRKRKKRFKKFLFFKKLKRTLFLKQLKIFKKVILNSYNNYSIKKDLSKKNNLTKKKDFKTHFIFNGFAKHRLFLKFHQKRVYKKYFLKTIRKQYLPSSTLLGQKKYFTYNFKVNTIKKERRDLARKRKKKSYLLNWFIRKRKKSNRRIKNKVCLTNHQNIKKSFTTTTAALKLNTSQFFTKQLQKKTIEKNSNKQQYTLIDFKPQFLLPKVSKQAQKKDIFHQKNLEQLKSINRIRKQLGKKSKKIFNTQAHVLRLRRGTPNFLAVRRKHRVYVSKYTKNVTSLKKFILPYTTLYRNPNKISSVDAENFSFQQKLKNKYLSKNKFFYSKLPYGWKNKLSSLNNNNKNLKKNIFRSSYTYKTAELLILTAINNFLPNFWNELISLFGFDTTTTLKKDLIQKVIGFLNEKNLTKVEAKNFILSQLISFSTLFDFINSKKEFFEKANISSQKILELFCFYQKTKDTYELNKNYSEGIYNTKAFIFDLSSLLQKQISIDLTSFNLIKKTFEQDFITFFEKEFLNKFNNCLKINQLEKSFILPKKNITFLGLKSSRVPSNYVIYKNLNHMLSNKKNTRYFTKVKPLFYNNSMLNLLRYETDQKYRISRKILQNNLYFNKHRLKYKNAVMRNANNLLLRTASFAATKFKWTPNYLKNYLQRALILRLKNKNIKNLEILAKKRKQPSTASSTIEIEKATKTLYSFKGANTSWDLTSLNYGVKQGYQPRLDKAVITNSGEKFLNYNKIFKPVLKRRSFLSLKRKTNRYVLTDWSHKNLRYIKKNWNNTTKFSKNKRVLYRKSVRTQKNAYFKKFLQIFPFKSLKGKFIKKNLHTILKKEKLISSFSNFSLKKNYVKTNTIGTFSFLKTTNKIIYSKNDLKKFAETKRIKMKQRYNYTNQIIKKLTRFLPVILKKLISNTSKKLPYAQLYKMVNAAYWNLRVYLKTKQKTYANAEIDQYFNNLRLQFKNLNSLSQKEINQIRFNLQPNYVIKHIVKKSNARNWLRAAFPKYYNLYTEDPTEYKQFFLPLKKIKRLTPSRQNPATWSSKNLTMTFEKQNQQINEQTASSSTRFENLLITNKRFLNNSIGGTSFYGTNVVLRSSSNSTSFFKRFFSVNTVAKKIILTNILNSNRTTNNNFIKTTTSLHDTLKERRIAALQILENTKFLKNNGELSNRLTRLKSARNLQYLQRFSFKHNTFNKNLLKITQPNSVFYRTKIQKKIKFIKSNELQRFLTIENSLSSAWMPKFRFLNKQTQKHFLLKNRINISKKHKQAILKNMIFFKKNQQKKDENMEYIKPFFVNTFNVNLKTKNIWAKLKKNKQKKSLKVSKQKFKNLSFFNKKNKLTKCCLSNFKRLADLNYSRVTYQNVNLLQNKFFKKNLLQSNSKNWIFKKKELTKQIRMKQYYTTQDLGFQNRSKILTKITSQKTRKLRILKKWLKKTSQGLRRNNWKLIPGTLFRNLRSRLRKLEWKEPDYHFQKPKRHSFRFHNNERQKAPWLEKLMYKPTLYPTSRTFNYRRYQFPKDQKKSKMLQFYRKTICGPSFHKKRKWPKFRIYNQKMFRSLFNMRNKKVAQKHFTKRKRHNSEDSDFTRTLTAIGNRLDVTLLLLNIAPTIFWARTFSTFGLLKINNKVVTSPSYQFKKNDRIYWNWSEIIKLKKKFQAFYSDHINNRKLTNASLNFPKNITYYHGIQTAIYKNIPKESDLSQNSRLNPFLLKMFKLDSISGK